MAAVGSEGGGSDGDVGSAGGGLDSAGKTGSALDSPEVGLPGGSPTSAGEGETAASGAPEVGLPDESPTSGGSAWMFEF